ncbi:MAG TPA: hypothetical protein PK014_09480 [Thermoanaerobaculia bacterium]|nr:hypothetical protein [Thermoanaerobaculia bacterium]HUM30417.1 hypothetical protein [Thermoanaerobaculia bacterium]HXK68572.1 hypothetical protein [Thermoanaerobaculia bacterium]
MIQTEETGGASQASLEDLKLSHAFLNILISGYRGKEACAGVAEQLGQDPLESMDLDYITKVIRIVELWIEDLWQGKTILTHQNPSETSGEGVTTLELFGRLRKELVAEASRVRRILQRLESLRDPGNCASILTALTRVIHSRYHYLKGIAEFSEHFEHSHDSLRWRQHLALCEQEVLRLRNFVETHSPLETVSNGFLEQLEEMSMTLTGTIRSQVHDMDLCMGRYAGVLTYFQAGIDDIEAEIWNARGFTPESAGYWQAFEFTAEEAQSWVDGGFDDPAIAGTWKSLGFGIGDARVWSEKGFLAREARDWKEAGYITRGAETESEDSGFSAADLRHWFTRLADRPSDMIRGYTPPDSREEDEEEPPATDSDRS